MNQSDGKEQGADPLNVAGDSKGGGHGESVHSTSSSSAGQVVTAASALAAVAAGVDFPQQWLTQVDLPGQEPVLPSSFAVGTAAQVSIAAAAMAGAALWQQRGGTMQRVCVPMLDAAREACGLFTIDGKRQDPWDKIAGVYPCREGWVRLHTNFAHHRDGVLSLLGCPTGPDTDRQQVAAALATWDAFEFEAAAAEARLVVAAARTAEAWGQHPQHQALQGEPLISIRQIGEAAPLPHAMADRPLTDVRVLDLTRILAGPVCGRTLAAYGADVMLINSPKLPNISAIADTSRGKRSACLDLKTAAGQAGLAGLLRDAHVFVQGYRPGGLQQLGFGPEALADARPGIVCVSLAAYGFSGPWAGRRGFDSLVQTATGFNLDEAQAAGRADPKPLPMQILDYASGFLMAFGAQVALLRQWRQGGSWEVRVSLARTGSWLRSLGRLPAGLAAPVPTFDDMMQTTDSGFGRLSALRHAAQFSRTPAGWTRPSVPPGTDSPVW